MHGYSLCQVSVKNREEGEGRELTREGGSITFFPCEGGVGGGGGLNRG